MNSILRRLALPLLLALLFVAGCKQGAGERCQLQTDCAEGLTCVIPQGGSLAEGGTCQAPTVLDGSFVEEDLTPAPSADAGTND